MWTREGGRGNVDAEAQGLRHSEATPVAVESHGQGHTPNPWMREGRPLLRHPREDSPVSDANPAKRIASEKEEQGSGRSFRRKAEAESSGLCDDAIPHGGAMQYVVVTAAEPFGGFFACCAGSE